MKRLLITGAAGALGKQARKRLTDLAETIRLSDWADMDEAGPDEEVVKCDLGDYDAVQEMVAGCDGIVHFGGMAVENTFPVILNANIVGVYNLYEAARKNGMPRIVFASSNHAVGFHRQEDRIDASAELRPDGLYGVSKGYGELMASMYHDKFGQETAIVRIGSCFPEPADHRALATWLSYDDLMSLIRCVFEVPRLGCPVIYGCSDNDRTFWDNRAVAYLGWKPRDNAAAYKDKIDAKKPVPGPDEPVAKYHGGVFTADGIHEE